MLPPSRALLLSMFKCSSLTRSRHKVRHRPRFDILEERTLPAVLVVNPAVPTDFQTIGAAITAAHSGDTIQVAQATYNEDVVINKSLSLVGIPNSTTKAKPIITGKGGASGMENVVAISPNLSGVLIQNFLITSPNATNATQIGIAIGAGDNNVTIGSNIIRIIRNASVPITGSSQTIGVQIGAKTHNIQITHNTITGITYDATGVNVSHQLAEGIALSSGTATDGPSHILIQHDLISKIGDIGINITNSSNAVVVDHITVALISGLNVGAGIEIGGTVGTPTNITISDNTIKQVSGKGATGVSVTGTATGVQLFGNLLTMVTTGVGLGVAGSASVSATDNNFTGNAFGVVIHTGFTGTLTLRFNNISGNTTDGVDNLATTSVDAEANWWGSATGPTNAGNPGGTGDKVAGTVDFSNWLTLSAGSAARVKLPNHALAPDAVQHFFTMTDSEAVW
jgi:Right handed beta helix region